jgi:hypothetical protein
VDLINVIAHDLPRTRGLKVRNYVAVGDGIRDLDALDSADANAVLNGVARLARFPPQIGASESSAPSASVSMSDSNKLARTDAQIPPFKPSAALSTVRTFRSSKLLTPLASIELTDGADDVDVLSAGDSGTAVLMRIIRVRARPPSRSKVMSMPVLRRTVATRRNRPAIARGLSGQVFALATRSLTILARAPRSSEAVPSQCV